MLAVARALALPVIPANANRTPAPRRTAREIPVRRILPHEGGGVLLPKRGVLTKDPRATRPQQRGQERQRHSHRDHHADRREVTHVRQERDVRQAQADQRDRHRQARENHRGTRSSRGQANRIGARPPLPQLIAVARHDEQRVVDADGQADHQTQRRRDGVQRQHRCRTHRHQRANTHAHDRCGQRQTSRQQRTERERKDDQRNHHAGDLRDRLNGDGVSEARAADLHVHARVARDLDRVVHRLPILVGDVGGQRHVVAEGHGAVAPVGGVHPQVLRVGFRGGFGHALLRHLIDEHLAQLVVELYGVAELHALFEVGHVIS